MRVRMSEEPKTFRAFSIMGSWSWGYGTTNGKKGWSPWPGIPYLVLDEGSVLNDFEVDLVPFPYSELPSQREIAKFSDVQRTQFMYCVKGWRGVQDENGNDVKFSEENKLKLFNDSQPFRTFVLARIDELSGSEITILKN